MDTMDFEDEDEEEKPMPIEKELWDELREVKVNERAKPDLDAIRREATNRERARCVDLVQCELTAGRQAGFDQNDLFIRILVRLARAINIE
jgi:hypothetical protein